MRDLASPFAALLEGDLDLVPLVSIDRAAGVLRYALHTHPITFGGLVYTETAGGFTEIEESAERRLPALRLALQNVDGVLGPLLHPGAGGEDVRGRRVTILQVSPQFVDQPDVAAYSLSWTFFVEAVSWPVREVVALDLGCFPAEVLQVPGRATQALRCRWAYKGEHCGYTGTLESCDKTFLGANGCRAHFPDDEPKRFGGFPGSADLRAGIEV